jgi:hypothetical protein
MQHTPAGTRICPHCDNFPIVAVDTGLRQWDGSRLTVWAECPTCDGMGHLPLYHRLARYASSYAQAGR